MNLRIPTIHAVQSILVQTVLLLGFSDCILAQETKSDAEDKATQRWLEFYRVVASEYEVIAPDVSEKPLEPSPEPLYTFFYPSHFRKPHGAFYVWTWEKRPYAVGCLWSQLEQNGRRTLVHELHSLSTNELTGTWLNRFQWRPTAAGLEFGDVPNTAPPGTTGSLQKTQLRAIARRFEGTSHREEDRPLKILPHPLYEYEIKGNENRRGALFGLFDERDAEILVLIEAQSKDDALRWMFAPVRFSDAPITLRCSEVVVWDQPAKGYSDSTKPYYSPRPTQYDTNLNDVVLPRDRK
jgi:hypothetical protein